MEPAVTELIKNYPTSTQNTSWRACRIKFVSVDRSKDPERLGSIGQKRGPDPLGQNLTDTVNQNQIGSGLVLHNNFRAVCGRTQPSLKLNEKLVAGWLRFARNWAGP